MSGLLLLLTGGALLVVRQVMVQRENPRARLPLWRGQVAHVSRTARGVTGGAGFFIALSGLVGDLGLWQAGALLALLLGACMLMAVRHNRRVARSTEPVRT